MSRRHGEVEQRGRFLGIAAIGLTVGVALFLLVFPAVEREAYLARLRTQDGPALKDAVLHLCWIRSGREGMNAVSAEVPESQRILIAKATAEVGCLDKLSSELKVTYHLHSDGDVNQAIAAGPSAVDMAVAGLSGDEGVRARSGALLLHLYNHLNSKQRERVLAATSVDLEEFAVLREALGAGRRAPKPISLVDIPTHLQLEEPVLQAPKGAILYVASPEEKEMEPTAPAPPPAPPVPPAPIVEPMPIPTPAPTLSPPPIEPSGEPVESTTPDMETP